MSQWANEHPEEMAEIAALPLNQQNAALRAAIGYDPDRIRDEHEERIHHHRSLNTSPGGSAPSRPSVEPQNSPGEGLSRFRRSGRNCDNCQAPEGVACQPWCRAEQIS